jgi:hypothetical protein
MRTLCFANCHDFELEELYVLKGISLAFLIFFNAFQGPGGNGIFVSCQNTATVDAKNLSKRIGIGILEASACSIQS